MYKIYNNKFRDAHNELMDFCMKCEKDEKAKCDQDITECDDLKLKLNRLYFEKLYPFHPCRKCLVRATCLKEKECGDYLIYVHSRLVADCKFNFKIVFFSSDKYPILMAPRLEITRDYWNQNPGWEELIDFDFTKKYITEIKNSIHYSKLLNIAKEYREYCAFANYMGREKFFEEEFF